ncbi:MAG: polymer-forming cytoskeletal protein [Alphaproteobacteria bacterium]|nr:polymer-forming cytoskeletal protein [Alphaproteobacteria bacterium]
MFSKTNKRPADAADPLPSLIGADMMIQGKFKSGGELHVEGTVEGDIAVKVLTVGKQAVIRGEVTSETVTVCGSVTGTIQARHVTLTAGARVVGDIHHEVLAIEAGASLEGMCKRREPVKAEALRDPTSGAAKGSEPVRLTPKPPLAEPIPLGAEMPRVASKG